MANFEKHDYGYEGLLYGDNYSESGTLTADAKVERGTIVVRDNDKEWIPADSSTLVAGAGLGVVVAFKGVEAGDKVAFDVGISGRFNRNLLKVDGNPITDAQADLLRGQGIIAIGVHSIDVKK